MPAADHFLQADAVFHGGRFDPTVGVTISRDGDVVGLSAAPPEGATVERLQGQVILGGFVNSHSHAFQRALRGRAEAALRVASFWSWRDEMYRLVAALGPDEVEAISRQAYAEMARAGYTRVKEFHYLHHQPGGRPYDDAHELARRVAQAAADAGLDLELVRVAYPEAKEDAQRRFADPSVEVAIERTADLAAALDVPVAIAPHSVRAVTPAGFAACATWSRQARAECHAHVAEQPREVEWCLETWGARPLQLLADHGVLGPAFVGVHLTHLDGAEIAQAGAAGIVACLCPTTEANLGDGVPRTRDLLDAGVRLAIGSDSQAEIDPFVELRLCEYNERNRLGRRRVLDPAALLAATTEPIRPGSPARLLCLDREHPSLLGVDLDLLPGAVVMAGTPGCIRSVRRGRQEVTPPDTSPVYRAALARL